MYTGGLTQEQYDALPVKGGRFAATHRDVGSYQVAHNASPRLGPEWGWHYFHPGKVDVRFAPDWFRTQLHLLDPRLEVVWHPMFERWTVWCRDIRVVHRWSPGWQFIFPWINPSNNGYLPLDERIFANIYARSPRVWENGKKYWDHIEAEVLRDKQKKEESHQDDARTMARDFWDSKQIKISMCGPSNGSKFANGQ